MEKLIEKFLTSKDARNDVEKIIAETSEIESYWLTAPSE